MRSIGCVEYQLQTRLLLLGHFALRLEGEPPQAINVSSKKARGLIAFVAMQPERSAERQDLATLLWGERSDRNARQALRQCLSILRAALNGAAPELLHTDGDKIRLSESISVDALELVAAAETMDAADAARAASLYRGPFLAGLDVQSESFEQWLGEQRLRIEMAAARLLEMHARQMDAANNGVQAVAAVDRLVAIDPLREDWQRLGLELYARHHGRDAALARAKAFTTMLTRELGVAAQAPTSKLIEDIKAGAFAHSAAPPAANDPVRHLSLVPEDEAQMPISTTVNAAVSTASPVAEPSLSEAASSPVRRASRWRVVKRYARRYGIVLGFFVAIAIDSILDAGVGPWYEKVFGETAIAVQPVAELSSQSRGGRTVGEAQGRSSDPAANARAAGAGAVPLLVIASREEGSADRYVTDAFTDQLTDSLAHFSGIKVLSRQTAHLFLTKSGDVTRLGSELGVRYVLEASLQPRASSTVINVQLIDTAKGVAIWSERAATASATLERGGTDISEALARNVDMRLRQFSRGAPASERRDVDAAAMTPR